MSRRICVHNRIIVAIREQVIAGDTAVGAEVGGVVGADESADLGIIISALQVVQTCLLVEDLAIVAKKEVLRPPPGEGSFTLLILYPEFQKSTRGFEKAGGRGFAHPPAGLLLVHRQFNHQNTESSYALFSQSAVSDALLVMPFCGHNRSVNFPNLDLDF